MGNPQLTEPISFTMKTTISLTLPRMGTLALSQMMNTTKCFSHHEVSQSMFVPGIAWERTYEGIAERAAHAARMDYFLPIAYNEIALKKRIKHEPTKAKLQVLIVFPSDSYFPEYIKSLYTCLSDAGQDGHTVQSLMIYVRNKMDQMITYAESLDDEIETAYVIKKSKSFDMDQILNIAKFTGAIESDMSAGLDSFQLAKMEYLSQCNMSLSSELLKKNIDNARSIITGMTPQ